MTTRASTISRETVGQTVASTPATVSKAVTAGTGVTKGENYVACSDIISNIYVRLLSSSVLQRLLLSRHP